MPNDPLLIPSLDDPVVRAMQKNASLEARIAALEARRDIVVTTVSANLSGGTTQFSWYGGRIWASTGGWLQSVVNVAQGSALLAYGRINGVTMANQFVTASAPSTGGFTTVAAIPFLGQTLDPTAYGLSTSALNTFSAVAYDANTNNANVQGLIIEWPQT